MRSFLDAAGTRHSPARPDARVVSLVPSITELLFDLGLGERIVGRTAFCVHPAAGVSSVPRVGGTKKVRVDRIRRLAATHVVVNIDENARDQVEEIASFVPHVIVTHPLEPRDNLALYRLLGGIFDREDRAEALCAAFEEAYEAVSRRASSLPPRQVLYLIWRDPWMTVSTDTYISRTLSLVKWQTLGGQPEIRYPPVLWTPEIEADTELVLLSSEPYPFKPRHVSEVRAAIGRATIPVALIDAEMTSWYGNRAIRGLYYLQDFAARV